MRKVLLVLTALMFMSTYAIAEEIIQEENKPADATAITPPPAEEPLPVTEEDNKTVPAEPAVIDDNSSADNMTSDISAEPAVIDDNSSADNMTSDISAEPEQEDKMDTDNETETIVLLSTDIVCDKDFQIPNIDNATLKDPTAILVSKQCRDKDGNLIVGIVRDMSSDNKSAVMLNEYTFDNGTLNGVMKVYYEDTGSLWIESTFESASLHGPKKSYRKDGTLEHQSNFVYGIQSGLSIGYYSTGKVEWESQYLGGKLNGESKRFYDNGTLKQTSNYVDDMLSGVEKNYNNTGRLIAEFNYENNILLNGKCYDDKNVATDINQEGLTLYTEKGIIPCD